MEAVKATIQDLMKTWETKRRLSPEPDPQELLFKVLGKKDCAHVKFHYFRDGVMGLKVDSSSRLYHLNMQKHGLLEKLRKQSGSAIKDLRMSVGEV